MKNAAFSKLTNKERWFILQKNKHIIHKIRIPFPIVIFITK
jgi:hypothetical protein